jgi:DNA-binding response OmpR family regulator
MGDAMTVDGLREVVLHVTDPASVSDGVASALRAAGLEVRGALLPWETIPDRLADIDLVVVDSRLGGPALLEVVRALHRATPRPLLCVTGAEHSTSDPAPAELETLCHAVLRRPVGSHRFMIAVRSLLATRRADARLAQRERVVGRLLEPAHEVALETDNLGIGVPPQMRDLFDDALRRLPSPASDVPATPTASPARTRGLVLIVDDEPEISRLFADGLEEAGYGVTSVTDGEKALTAVIKEEPDVVLLDLNMPRLNGIETLGAIRAIAPLLQVIIVSGGGTLEDAAQARSYGAFDYLLKPLDPGYLVSRVEAALDADAQNDESLA